jgi:hypothetical protein
MPIQTYRCPYHGDFDISVPFGVPVPKLDACPEHARRAAPEGSRMARCYFPSPWQPPTGISFKIK